MASHRQKMVRCVVSAFGWRDIARPNEAVFGNVGSYVSFRMREADARRLVSGNDGFNANVISDLGRGEVVAQLLQDGFARTRLLRLPTGRKRTTTI